MSDDAPLLRRAFLLLTAATGAVAVVELVSLRHWGRTLELVPFLALGLLAVGVGLRAWRPTRRTLLATRAAAIVVGATALVGVFVHIQANYDAGPLDFRYATKWATMSATSRWWAAATESVGPAPVLAPAVLTFAAICLWCATLRHPALRSARG